MSILQESIFQFPIIFNNGIIIFASFLITVTLKIYILSIDFSSIFLI